MPLPLMRLLWHRAALSEGVRITGLLNAIKTLRNWATTPQTLRLSDGRTLRWIKAGLHLGSAEPLLLIHGVRMQTEAWGPQLGLLGRMIVADTPGHGGTCALVGGAFLPDYMAWAARAMHALGLQSADVTSHSMGALVTLGSAATHPEKICRVNGVSAWFGCAVHQVVEAGDNAQLIGRVEAFASYAPAGLGHYRGSYFTASAAAVAPGRRLSSAPISNATVACY